jgi:L-alanine-DL-glutamate epimerase-like enolase superfamily enzyme
MKITAIRSRSEHMELLRPYTVTYKTSDSVTNLIVEIETDNGILGLGAASPSIHVTGESDEACATALGDANLGWLIGCDVRTLPALCRRLNETMAATPAARAAVDIALHDALAQHLELPLVEMLGRVHTSLPTSITIGIKSTEEALAEADEYLGRGFKVLKVKLGQSLEQDLERLHKLRERVGRDIVIRVDPNQGYTAADVERFVAQTATLDIEFLEQPMPADQIEAMRALAEPIRRKLAADETLLNEHKALELVMPPAACGIFNIKLMKCGGVRPALRIATLAEIAGIELMWGCMDESIISITAALHAALASPATRYLDLDGSLDLARDVVSGGFVLQDGCLSTGDLPGLGVRRLA